MQHYINQGGSEMAVFTPSGAWTEAGVKVGDYTFRSFPLPNHPGQYFSLFALSWHLPVTTPISVYREQSFGRGGEDHVLVQSVSEEVPGQHDPARIDEHRSHRESDRYAT